MSESKTDICLHAEKIDKVYPGTKALDQVSFDVHTGKVNVLIGENGAGKSTLMKIIAGIEQPTAGKLYMDGKEVSFKNTTEAQNMGIGIIHQELSLFPNLNVYQNIFMAKEKTKYGVALDNKKHFELSNKALQRLEYPLDPNTNIGDLRVGQQQMVEIARNLTQENLKILIMDEPTSSLSESEVEALFKIMKEMTAEGISIIYISHRLEEIMRIGDRVTILRDAKLVAEAPVSEIDISWIVQKMVGEGKMYRKHVREIDWNSRKTELAVKNLTLPKSGGGYLLDHVNFELKKGEVLGIYGLLGSGRTEILECLMGLRQEHTGQIAIQGKEMPIQHLSRQIEKGFALVPEDRQSQGLVQTMDIGQNVVLSSLKKNVKGLFLNRSKMNANIDSIVKDLHIKVADKALPILSLSGGNQQKVVIAKGMLTDPQILLLDEPSRGIDVGAKKEVFEIIHEYSEKGLSIIVVSSELKEIIAIADRIVVLSNGKKTAELVGDDITEDQLVIASYKGHSGNQRKGDHTYENKS